MPSIPLATARALPRMSRGKDGLRTEKRGGLNAAQCPPDHQLPFEEEETEVFPHLRL